MGIFRVDKKDLNGKLVESYAMQNTILDAGLEYLCTGGTNFNDTPTIGVGSSDITPDTNQVGLIAEVASNTATFTPGISTIQNPNGNTQFLVSTHFNSNQAIGELTELSYFMNGTPLNRTLFQTPGFLDTRFANTPELDQFQNVDISNVTQVYGSVYLDQTFVVGASGGAFSTPPANLTEVALSLASSGNPAYPLTVEIFSDNSGQPGTVLGTTTIAAFSEPVQRWRIATFPSTISVTASSTYHIVVSCPNTDQADAYDVFGSVSDVYTYGQLSQSLDGGNTFAPVSPSQDLGFKTYYSETGATTHDYVITQTQFDKETAASPDLLVTAFPVNNLDSTSTNQGTVRLSLPTFQSLGGFVENIKVYKKVGSAYGLLATLGTVRQYFYDNGSVAPDLTHTPPVSSAITTPTGLAITTDTTNGGNLQLGQNRYYVVSAVQQGPIVNSINVGPWQYNGTGTEPSYATSSYSTTPVPLYGTEYETAASGEVMLTAPATAAAPFTEYFSNATLDSTKWNITNANSDYFNILKLSSTNENQLQMNVPQGVPFVISSTRQARPGQNYYLNVQIPLTTTPTPNTQPGNQPNPLLDGGPNRVAIFSFLNPTNVNTLSNDKRLTFEYGFYKGFKLDNKQADTSQHGNRYFALYDNIGNVYLFSASQIPTSHSDGAYTFKIDILSDRSMQISVLNGSTRSFQPLTGGSGFAGFKTQFNYNHGVGPNQQLPGPQIQTTNHFIVPSNYSFAIGNPSADPNAFNNNNYISVNDSLYTIAGTSPTVPVPAIAMTVNGSVVANAGGFGATLTWNAVSGARKYRLYASTTSGNYSAANGALVYDYETYFPAYAVQSTDTPNNDFNNGFVAVGSQVRNWQDIGVTYAVDANTTGNFNGYALGAFVGSTSANQGNPLVPPNIISPVPGSAENYLLSLTSVTEKAIFTFMGGGFAIVAETGPSAGMGALYIDGNFVENIDFYTPTTLEQQTVFTTSALTPGLHTIWITPTGQANDFSLGTAINLDYFHITVPAIVDLDTVIAGNPLTSSNSNIAPVSAPTIKGATTYNGNGPTVVSKDPQHTLDITMTFSLINPNL